MTREYVLDPKSVRCTRNEAEIQDGAYSTIGTHPFCLSVCLWHGFQQH